MCMDVYVKIVNFWNEMNGKIVNKVVWIFDGVHKFCECLSESVWKLV